MTTPLDHTTTNAKAWFQRPTPTEPATGFAERLTTTQGVLIEAARHDRCALAHSLSAEDMVLFHLIATLDLPIESIALDTGKLPQLTHELWQTAEARYGRSIKLVKPAPERLSILADLRADSELYNDKTIRELCCSIRKTEPLRRALSGRSAWVTGLRRAQSNGRSDVSAREFDPTFGLEKFNPLVAWSDEDVWYFVARESIPINALYDKGYASIGCDPCTRPIRFDEHPRAGRWWWEQTTSSECGIHVASQPMTYSVKETV